MELRDPIRRDDRYVVLETSAATTDYDGDGVRDREVLRLENAIAAIESVTVPAGTVAEAARVDTIATATITLSGNGRSVSASAVASQWYAKGLGVIKRQFTDPNFSAPNNVVTEVLIGLETPTASAGIGREFRLYLPPATEPAATAAVTSDGTNLFVVAPRVRGSANQANQIVGRLFNPAGALLWERVVLESANADLAFGEVAVAFEAGTYYVLAHRYNFMNSIENQLVGQRLSTTGNVMGDIEGSLIDQGDYVRFVPARPRFNGPRTLFAWRRENRLGGFDHGSHFVAMDNALVPVSTSKKASQSNAVPFALPNMQRLGEFVLLSDQTYFDVSVNGEIGNPTGTELIPLSWARYFAAATTYGSNILYAWVGDGSSGSAHLLHASVLFANPQSGTLAPRTPRVIATASTVEQLSIGWVALEATPTALALVYSETRSGGPNRLKFAWLPVPQATTSPPDAGVTFTLSRFNEYEPRLPRIATAADHIFVVKESRPDPLFAYGFETAAVVMRGPFVR